MKTYIDKFGRVVIPKSIRDDMGLSPGKELEVSEDDENAIILRVVGHEIPLVREGSVLVYGGQATGDVAGALRNARQERLHKLSKRISN